MQVELANPSWGTKRHVSYAKKSGEKRKRSPKENDLEQVKGAGREGRERAGHMRAINTYTFKKGKGEDP